MPLAIRAPHGFGRVTVLAPDMDELARMDSRAARALLGWATGFALDSESLAPLDQAVHARERNAAFPFATTPSFPELTLGYFASTPGLAPAPFGWVAIYLLAYLLLAGPLAYWWLARRDRLGWAWWLLPGLAAVAGGIAVGGAMWLKGGLASRAVSVLEQEAGSETTRILAYTGLFTPPPAEALDLDFGGGAYPAIVPDYPVEWRYEIADSQLPAHVREGQLEGVRVFAWDCRLFVSERFGTAESAASGELRREGGTIAGTIRAGLYGLHGAVLVGREGVYEVGDVSPGGEWSPAGWPIPLGEYMAGLVADMRMNSDTTFYASAPVYDVSASLSPQVDMDSPASQMVRKLAMVSFSRMLHSWRHRALLRDAQFLPMAVERGRNVRRGLASSESPDPEWVTVPLSLEQIWNARFYPQASRISDLSETVRGGGWVLLARTDRAASDAPDVPGRLMDREGVTLVRVLFPVAGGGGASWGDDLYGNAGR